MQKNIKRLLAAKIVLFLAVVYTFLITTLSLIQLGKISVGDFNPTDKMLHSGAYFVLTSLWLFYYTLVRPQRKHRTGFLKIVGAIVAFGMLIEVLQGTLTSYRQPDWADILANTIGVFVAWGIFMMFQRFLGRVKHQISSFL